MRPRVTVARAHAKINLDLRVLGTRLDGYHELRTVFQAVALHDTVTCVQREGPFAIECTAAGVPLDRSNLIWRAAEALWGAIGGQGPLRDVVVQVEKRIPLQAGLGGGSSDAAATLTALARLWRATVDPPVLVDLAGVLGADVPFFLSGGTALGLGRGDEVSPLADWPRHWIVLLVPGFGVATRDAFAWYEAERDLSRDAARVPQDVPEPWPIHGAEIINDLEGAIARHHPEIERMKTALTGAGAVAAAMSGSGSTVFGLFERRNDAGRAATRLSGSGWRVLRTESIGRGEYMRRSRAVVRRPATGAPEVA